MRNSLIIPMTFIVAFILMLLPMPDWATWCRPAWVLMVLIYWIIVAPYHINVGTAWILGVLVDIATGTVLGEHAFAYTVIAFLIARMQMRFRLYSMLQQTILVGMLILLYQGIIYCLQGFLGQLPADHLYWSASLTSTILWPWVFSVLHSFERQTSVR